MEPESTLANAPLHHVGIAVRDLARAIPAYERTYGYRLISGPFDDPIQNVSVCFLRRSEADVVLELVAPLGPDSPIHRILKKSGGTYHLCYEIADIEAAIARLRELGCFHVSGPVPAVAFEQRKIAWMMDKEGLLIELLEMAA